MGTIFIGIRYVAKYASVEIIGCKNNLDDCDKMVCEHGKHQGLDTEHWTWMQYEPKYFEHESVVKMYGHVDSSLAFNDEPYHVYEIQEHESE